MPVPNTQTAFNTAVANLGRDQTASIETLTALAAGESPEAGPAARVLGMLALQKYNDPNALDQAITHLEHAATCGDAEGMFQLAVVYQGIGKPAEALELHERSTRLGHGGSAYQWFLALEQNPNNQQPWHETAVRIGTILYGATEDGVTRQKYAQAIVNFALDQPVVGRQGIANILDTTLKGSQKPAPSLGDDLDIGSYAAGTTDVSNTPPGMAL